MNSIAAIMSLVVVLITFSKLLFVVWCVIGRALDSQIIACSFESWPGVMCKQATYTCVSLTKQYNLVPVKGRCRSEAVKVTVGLSMHWTYVTDSVVYLSTGLKACVREINILPTLRTLYLLAIIVILSVSVNA